MEDAAMSAMNHKAASEDGKSVKSPTLSAKSNKSSSHKSKSPKSPRSPKNNSDKNKNGSAGKNMPIEEMLQEAEGVELIKISKSYDCSFYCKA